MEIDGLQDTHVPGDGERVLPDEQVLEVLESGHRVTRADPDNAFVGLDTDQRDVEGGARDRIPGRRERGVEGQAQTLQPDAGDPHAASIADGVTRPRARHT
jgi:hypothetical protein